MKCNEYFIAAVKMKQGSEITVHFKANSPVSIYQALFQTKPSSLGLCLISLSISPNSSKKVLEKKLRTKDICI